MRFPLLLPAAILGLGFAVTPSAAGEDAAAPCDRVCMTGLADRLVASMIAHDAGAVPVTSRYRATENGVAAALPMMSLWRTPSDAVAKHYLIDAEAGEMFLVVTLREGGPSSLFWGRLKVEGRKFSELELFLTRSRADAGYQYDADGMAALPVQWTMRVAPGRLMARAELTGAGRSMFDTSIQSPPAHADCRLMENGKVVGEEPDMMAFMLPPGSAIPTERNPDGSIPMPCPIVDERPVDPRARVITDAEEGLVVAIATVDGIVQPYPVTTPSWTAFVPGEMTGHYEGALARANATGKYTSPVVDPAPATIFVAQMFRIYDRKVQGMHLFQKMSAPGSRSIWTAPPAVPVAKE